ncbi:MAG: hypothetical protein OEY13_11895 [Gammaproteobacteria bacterium]|nr:hypothetical protein [Gammaproteobacteria bacterium]MDH5273767.1 hypothetical protein [Gammaproteobacteria bacterium]
MRKSILILALLLAGCGGDGDGAGPPPAVQHAPFISNLKLSPDNVVYMTGGGAMEVSAELTFSDAGRDIRTLWVGMPDGTRLEFSEASSAITGTVSEQIAISTNVAGTFTVDIWLVDKAGDSSNHLAAKFEVVSDVMPTAWTRRLGGLPFELNDVSWTGSSFVAVGGDGKVLTSTDGIGWVERSSPVGVDLIAVASRESDVVAVGGDATVVLSTDGGATWSIKHTGKQVRLAAVAISPSQIVTGGMELQTGDAFMMRSLDRGETWKVIDTLPQSGHFIIDLIHANGLFVAGTDVFSWESDARVMVSVDGQVWHEIILRDDVAALHEVLHDGQQFIAAGSDATVFASPDGYNWKELNTPVDRVDYLSSAWNGSRLVVAGGITWWYWWVGTPSFERPIGLSSTDGGATWEILNIDGYYQSNGMAWGNGRFVSVGQLTPDSGEGAIYSWD